MIVVALFVRMSKEIKVLSWPDRTQFQIFREKNQGIEIMHTCRGRMAKTGQLEAGSTLVPKLSLFGFCWLGRLR